MKELEQLKKLIEGYEKLIGEIDSWGPQPKGIQEHLDILKTYFRQMIDVVRLLEKLIVRIGPDEIKAKLGKDSIQKDLLKWADSLRDARIGLKDWEAQVKKDSVKSQ
jgi:hypothetical protein